MPSLPPPEGVSTPPRPSICPICGLSTNNGIAVRSELAASATYVDTEGHQWTVMWPEVGV